MAGQTENHAAAARHRARAFGLEIDCSFDASGLAPATGPPSGREVRLDLRPVEEIDRVWAGERSNGERTIDVRPRLDPRHRRRLHRAVSASSPQDQQGGLI